MSFAPFRFIRLARPEVLADLGELSRVLMAMQDAVATSLRSVQTPIVDGVLLRDVALTTTSINVPHGLGRRWNGYIVTRRSAAQDVYDGTGTADATKEINLRAGGSVTVDLWVF